MFSIRTILRRSERFVIYRILHADDTPHRLAMGIAVGFFIAWTPTIGFQMALVVLLASLLKVNRLVGVPIVWISNPFTLVPIYYPNYRIGRFLLSLFGTRPELTMEQMKKLLAGLTDRNLLAEHLADPDRWRNLWKLCVELLNLSIDLWVGSIVVGLIVGILSYILSYRFIVWYRANHPLHRLRHVIHIRHGEKHDHDANS